MDTSRTLAEAIIDFELRHTNFFNGSLLSAEALSAERDATHAHARYLGKAIGEGVAYGLEVSRADSRPSEGVQLQITAGLAVNRAGQTLYLKCDQVVALVRPSDPAKMDQCVFADCGLSTADTGLSGDGLYLLTIAPASQTEGLAPVSGLGNTPAECNSRYFTEGVQFRLLPFGAFEFEIAGHARNEVAYHCFGRPATDVETFLDEVFGIADAADYGTGTLLPSGRLAESDVPLAILEWRSASGLRFVDEWSVRRPLTTRAAAGDWNYFAAGRRVSEAIAMLLQFQKHLAELPAVNGSFATVKARDHFTWLPAAGLLPVGGEQFNYEEFFDGIALDEKENNDLAFLRLLLRQSFFIEPFNLISEPPGSIQIFKFTDRTDFVLFTRGEKLESETPAPEPTTPGDVTTPGSTSTPPTRGSGQFFIGVKLPKQSHANAKLAEVWVQAAGKRGRHGTKLFTPTQKQISKLLKGFNFRDKEVSAVFATDELPFGDYSVFVRLDGFNDWKEEKKLNTHRFSVLATLETKIKDQPARPKDFGNIRINGNDYVTVVKPFPLPPETLKQWLKDRDSGYIDPPRDARERIRGQIWTMLEEDQDLPVTTESVRLLVDNAYTGDSVTDGPAAVLEGTGGTGLPVVLVRADYALPFEVSTARSGVREFTSGGLQSKLAEAGLDDLQVASHLPANLFAEITGVDIASARGLISELKLAIQRVRGNQTYYPGLSDDDAKLLKGKFDDVGLANASTTDIVKTLTGLEANVIANPPADKKGVVENATRYAERLKSYARSFVSDSAWSLEKSGLGFNDTQITALRNKSIDSVEELTKASVADLTGALGWSDAVVVDVQKSAGVNLGAGRVALNPEPPLASIARVNAEFAAKLSEAGIDSTSELASTDAEEIAATLNISKDDAVTIVKSAIAAVLSTRGGLTADDANKAVAGAGATTLQDVVEHTVSTAEAAPGPGTSATLNNLRALRNMVRGFR